MRSTREKLLHAWRVFARTATMPWACQQAAIEQILGEPDLDKKSEGLQQWKKFKTTELTNVSIIGTIIASATTGSIQWGTLGSAHWIVSASWYITLVFSLVGVIVGFYLTILLSNFGINKNGDYLLFKALQQNGSPNNARWGALFTLQLPMMILSYSLISYITGLSVMVLTPLWTDPWGASCKIAIFYCVAFVLSLLLYFKVCYFIYVENEELLKVC